MVDFDDAIPRHDEDGKFLVTEHAAERWLERVGFDIEVAAAREVLAQGLQDNARLAVATKSNRYYEWNGLVFPCVVKTTGGIVVTSTLLKGMATAYETPRTRKKYVSNKKKRG